jgi:hypothetical protein
VSKRIKGSSTYAPQRSALSNSPYRLPGVDMRSAAGRRWIDITGSIIAKFGDGDPEAVRELTGLRFAQEATQAAVVAGDVHAREDLVRLSRVIDRKEAALRQSAMAARVRASEQTWGSNEDD